MASAAVSARQPVVLARAEDLIGRPVVAIVDGEAIAEIKDVIFEPDRHALMGFTLNKRGFWHGSLHELLPAVNVAAVGADAVMVESNDALVPPDDVAPVLFDERRRHRVIGARVLTTSGRSLGRVTGVVLALGRHFDVAGYEIDGPDGAGAAHRRFVPIDAQIALSADALLVPDGVEPFVRDDLAGFGAAVDAFRAQLPTTADPASDARSEGRP